MKKRIIFSAITVIAQLVICTIYRTAQSPIEGSVAAGQVNDSVTPYVATQALTSNVVPHTVSALAVLILILIWAPAICKELKK